MNNLTIILTDKYILVFDISQTHYSVYDEFISNIFWPQTKYFGNTTIWQPSGPIVVNKDFNWTLSEQNLIYELIPFENCQSIPIKVKSAKSSNLTSTAFTLTDNQVIIDFGVKVHDSTSNLSLSNSLIISIKFNLIYLVDLNQTVVLTIEAETNTTVPIVAQSDFSITVYNSIPIFENTLKSVKVKISEGLNLSIIYSKYCSSDSQPILINDNEGDSIYLKLSIIKSGFIIDQVILDDQNWAFNININTSFYTPGNYSMLLNIWDLFHLDTYSEIAIDLDVSYFVPPVFTNELPSLLTIQICTQTRFDFPEIFDKDGDFSRVEILNKR